MQNLLYTVKSQALLKSNYKDKTQINVILPWMKKNHICIKKNYFEKFKTTLNYTSLTIVWPLSLDVLLKSFTVYISVLVLIGDAYSHLITLLWASINSSHITHSFLKCTHSESFFHNFIQHFFMHIKTYENKIGKRLSSQAARETFAKCILIHFPYSILHCIHLYSVTKKTPS